MKKYFLSALALPLLFACSSEDYLDQKATDNDQFAGIEKVDATFSLADSPKMRLATKWGAELNDRLGFAWLTNNYTGSTTVTKITIDGQAYQNHPLFLKQDGDQFKFVPETSIYVGKYFVYYPFDETTTDIGKINFKSLEEQPLTDGQDKFKALAVNSINIGDKFTEVTPDGTTVSGKTWDKAGIKANYKLYAAPFSNQTGLDLTYKNNNVEAPDGGMKIKGATDIDYTIAAGTKIGAADIYEATVELDGASKSFTYGPTADAMEPIQVAGATEHKSDFWANKKNVAATYGFTFTNGAVTLKAPKNAVNGISTEKDDNKGWFWFNSLPVDAGDGTTTTTVDVVLTTSYGTVTVKKDYDTDKKYTVGDCAWEFDKTAKKFIKLTDAAGVLADPTQWDVAAHNTFINQYGDHAGKFALDVDFSKGVMNGMHIKNDDHLQKLLKYYIAAKKTESPVVLNLDQASATDNTFKISKISIALIQTIQAAGKDVKVQACTTHGTPKIIVTQDGSAGKTEVPALDKVFATATDVYLAAKNSDGTVIAWTWAGGENGKTALTIDDKVSSITNEGTLTVNATNVQLSNTTSTLKNAKDATMDITKVTTVKNALTNLGTINVKEGAELRAYGVEIKNDATGLNEGEYGVINNSGVVGKTEGTPGQFNNYGLIDMKVKDAITLLNSNEIGTKPFGTAFTAGTNMMGTVVLPENNPTAIVSVANADANGFIKYTWPATETTYKTPAGNVKYNTIVVSGDIEFTVAETEIQYIEFNGTKTQVVNPGGLLTNLKGVRVNAGKSIIIEKGNKLNPKVSVFLGEGATVYKGGTFTINGAAITGTITNYFGNWTADQIVAW